MTKRRSIIALFLAVAILALGVGYAALTDTLDIGGTAQTPGFDAMLKYNAAYTGEVVAKGAAAVDFTNASLPTGVEVVFSDNSDIITITVDGTLSYDNDYIEFVFTLANTSVYDADLTLGAITGNNANFTTTASLSATEIAKTTGTVDVTVRITLTAAPTGSAESVTSTFAIPISAETK